MKSGTGDPFADDESENNDAESDSQPAAESGSDSASEAESTAPDTETEADANSETETQETPSRDQYPLTLRRDNVKDERPNVHQLFVQDSTDEEAKSAERELEDRLGEDVYRLDAREAIYLAGMQNLDGAEEILREWGYDL